MVILIYDVHASESGALAILDDLYKQVCNNKDKNIKWIFAVSIPKYENKENIEVLRYPWVKNSWFHRLYFDNFTTRKILKQYSPDIVFSLQNKGISFYKGIQYVYLHLPFILTDYKFNIKRDGKKLWFYQNILSKSIFVSLRKVTKTIVQTKWMKDELIKKAKVKPENIILVQPDITTNDIGTYINNVNNRKNFFYPATSFTYKNHMTILKACKYIQDKGIHDYEVVFTILSDENNYTKSLYKYAQENKLHVKFIGSMPRKQVFDMYTKSTLLFPSFVESFGLPLLEARLSGSFVIASNCSFSREILDNYENCEYFKELDYEKLGEHMIKIINGSRHYVKCKEDINRILKNKKNTLVEIILKSQ